MIREQAKRQELLQSQELLTNIFGTYRTARQHDSTKAFEVLQDALAENAGQLICTGLIGIKDMVGMLVTLSGDQDKGSGAGETAIADFLRRGEPEQESA